MNRKERRKNRKKINILYHNLTSKKITIILHLYYIFKLRNLGINRTFFNF